MGGHLCLAFCLLSSSLFVLRFVAWVSFLVVSLLTRRSTCPAASEAKGESVEAITAFATGALECGCAAMYKSAAAGAAGDAAAASACIGAAVAAMDAPAVAGVVDDAVAAAGVDAAADGDGTAAEAMDAPDIGVTIVIAAAFSSN